MSATKIVEVVGRSTVSSDDAVKSALAQASRTLRNVQANDVVSIGRETTISKSRQRWCGSHSSWRTSPTAPQMAPCCDRTEAIGSRLASDNRAHSYGDDADHLKHRDVKIDPHSLAMGDGLLTLSPIAYFFGLLPTRDSTEDVARKLHSALAGC